MNKKDYLASQKDCANMLGVSLAQYMDNLKIIKCSKFKKGISKGKGNDLLKALGLSNKDLKRKRGKSE